MRIQQIVRYRGSQDPEELPGEAEKFCQLPAGSQGRTVAGLPAPHPGAGGKRPARSARQSSSRLVAGLRGLDTPEQTPAGRRRVLPRAGEFLPKNRDEIRPCFLPHTPEPVPFGKPLDSDTSELVFAFQNETDFVIPTLRNCLPTPRSRLSASGLQKNRDGIRPLSKT